MIPILSPSLLSADFSCLGREVEELENAGVTWLHLDVMDGMFVPNISFGAPVIAALRKKCSLFFDAHLMVREPGRYLDDFVGAGCDLLVIHQEAVLHPQRELCAIHAAGLKAGVSLNPGTSLENIRWLLPEIDVLLLMGANPGFSGQKFIPQTIAKTRAARAYLDECGFGDVPIEVDGGVDLQNAPLLAQAGASILVSGSAFFRQDNYVQARGAFLAACSEIAARELPCARWTRAKR